MPKLPKKFEGSKADMAEDKKTAKKFGMPLKKYEKSPQDRKKDAEGQKKLDMKRGKK